MAKQSQTSSSLTNPHSVLVNDVLLAIGSLPYCRVWKNATGTARALHEPTTIIQYGLPGSADIIGLLRTVGGQGLFLAIECKTGKAKQTKEQIAFENMVHLLGGIYFVAHEEDVLDKAIVKRLEQLRNL